MLNLVLKCKVGLHSYSINFGTVVLIMTSKNKTVDNFTKRTFNRVHICRQHVILSVNELFYKLLKIYELS